MKASELTQDGFYWLFSSPNDRCPIVVQVTARRSVRYAGSEEDDVIGRTNFDDSIFIGPLETPA